MKRTGALALVLLSSSCDHAAPPPAHVTLSGDAVAIVGDVTISRSLVARVASAQKVTPREALDALIDDAIAAQEARARGLDRRPDVAWQSTAALGRIATERVYADARAKGPPTDDEIDKATARRWRDFDLPEHIRVIHAVVLKKKNTDPRVAREVAEAILAAVRGSADDKAFEASAKAVDARGNEVRVESLPSFTQDGRMVEQDGGLDAQFTAGAYGLQQVGDTSTIVETTFGWHVIKLLEKLPAHRVPLEERRVALGEIALTFRARSTYEATLNRLANGAAKVIDPAADGLMASVVGP